MTHEVSPLYVMLKLDYDKKNYLVDVCTLNLRHRDKVISQHFTIVFSNSSNLVKTLVCVKR